MLSEFHGSPIEHRQRAWQSQTDRANRSVRRGPEGRRTPAEDLSLGQELRVEDGPPEGAPAPDLDPEPQLTAPVGPDPSELDPVMLEEYARRIFGPDIKDDIKRRKDGNGGGGPGPLKRAAKAVARAAR